MNRTEKLKAKLKWLSVLLAIVPLIYAGIIWMVKKTSKKAKIIIIVTTIVFVVFYAWIGHEWFETKRELQKTTSITLTISSVKPKGIE